MKIANVDVSATVRRVLKEHGRLHIDANALQENEDLYNAGMNSHASVNVMVALENEFEVEFPDQMLNRGTFDSVASIRTAIESLLAAA
jgi:acyl carrier protein